MTNIRQSKEYAFFMQKLGWSIEQLKVQNEKFKVFVFLRKFPIIGSFVKILRPEVIPRFKDLKILQKYRPFKIQIEPDICNVSKSVTPVTQEYKKMDFKLSNNPLTPTKSILIDLKPDESEIFSSFSEEKRRAVRRAIKNKIVVNKSDNMEDFVKLKNQQLWPFGFLLSGEIRKLWEVFRPENKAILLFAHSSVSLRALKNSFTLEIFPEIFHVSEFFSAWQSFKKKIASSVASRLPRNDNMSNNILAGVLLLFHSNISYYWLASATDEGKKLFVPTLLVWEAIKLSKKLGYKVFDFEGIEDDRFPKTKSWRGFSKFKKGFGGKEIIYPQPMQKTWLNSF